MNTTQIGNISEAKILARFVELGYQVLIPFNQGCRYDLVIERDGHFQRIQAKTGRMMDDNDYILFNTESIYTTPHHAPVSRDYHQDVDAFAVYCPQNDRCYLVSVDESPQSRCILRLTPPRNNQHKGIRWAHDYEL